MRTRKIDITPDELLTKIKNYPAVKYFNCQDLVFGEGYTPNNVLSLQKCADIDSKVIAEAIGIDESKLKNPSENEMDYTEFVALVDYLRPTLMSKNFTLNQVCKEIGYSAYNFGLLVEAVGWEGGDFSSYIGWSVMKYRQHTTKDINKSFFRPIKYQDWLIILEIFKSLQQYAKLKNLDSLKHSELLVISKP